MPEGNSSVMGSIGGTPLQGRARISTVCRWFAGAVTACLLMAALPAHAMYASYVIDADTGEVLQGTNEDTRNYPASLTKMMTLYLVFEKLKSKQWTMATRLKVSQQASYQPPSKLGVKPGDTLSVKEAILALVTRSANDVATVIAENISGQERSFALKMTAKARAIGMNDTTFRNASGLPHRAQMSTAHDMAMLARALLRDFPEYYYLFSTEEFVYEGKAIKNHNELLNSYPGADGFKTGYIRASGYNLVASATRNGRRIIGVVFGGRTSAQRNQTMAGLLDQGFDALAKNGKSSPAAIAKAPRQRQPQAPEVQVASSSSDDDGKVVWGVQVGAFSREDQARAAAEAALKKASQYLQSGQIKIVPLQKRNGTVLHRARVVGISKGDAFKTCKLLKDCMELQDNLPPELASRVD